MIESVPNPLNPDNSTDKQLFFWKQNKLSKSILAKLAHTFLSPTPGSVSSEMLLSTATDIACDRNKLLPDKFEYLW